MPFMKQPPQTSPHTHASLFPSFPPPPHTYSHLQPGPQPVLQQDALHQSVMLPGGSLKPARRRGEGGNTVSRSSALCSWVTGEVSSLPPQLHRCPSGPFPPYLAKALSRASVSRSCGVRLRSSPWKCFTLMRLRESRKPRRRSRSSSRLGGGRGQREGRQGNAHARPAAWGGQDSGKEGRPSDGAWQGAPLDTVRQAPLCFCSAAALCPAPTCLSPNLRHPPPIPPTPNRLVIDLQCPQLVPPVLLAVGLVELHVGNGALGVIVPLGVKVVTLEVVAAAVRVVPDLGLRGETRNRNKG